MSEYDIAFGEKLAEVAKSVMAEGMSSLDAKRTVLYLSPHRTIAPYVQ